jgi:hypothetical protein
MLSTSSVQCERKAARANDARPFGSPTRPAPRSGSEALGLISAPRPGGATSPRSASLRQASAGRYGVRFEPRSPGRQKFRPSMTRPRLRPAAACFAAAPRAGRKQLLCWRTMRRDCRFRCQECAANQPGGPENRRAPRPRGQHETGEKAEAGAGHPAAARARLAMWAATAMIRTACFGPKPQRRTGRRISDDPVPMMPPKQAATSPTDRTIV